jgi:hypothetical protein
MKLLYEIQFLKGGRSGRCYIIAASTDDILKYEEREQIQIIHSRPVASTFGNIFAKAGEDVLLTDMTEKKDFF